MAEKRETGAAVLAAGFGERIQDCGRPKPLVRVGGLTLLALGAALRAPAAALLATGALSNAEVLRRLAGLRGL